MVQIEHKLVRCTVQLALVLRGLARGYPPPLPFAIVSMVVTGVLTVGWRTALSALSPQVTRWDIRYVQRHSMPETPFKPGVTPRCLLTVFAIPLISQVSSTSAS